VLLLPVTLGASGFAVIWLWWLLGAGLVTARFATAVLQAPTRRLELRFDRTDVAVAGRRFGLVASRIVAGTGGDVLVLRSVEGDVLCVHGRPRTDLERLHAWAQQTLRATGTPSPIPDDLVLLVQGVDR
jgi:hypothetical protein